MKKVVFVFLIFLSGFCSLAQDPQLTQFYAAPLYLNPAYTGADVCYRVSSNYRNQWASLPKAYMTYLFSLDHSLPQFNSGIGFIALSDRAGAGSLRTNSFGVSYSYVLQINKLIALRAGLRASYTFRDVNFGDLIFSDQLLRNAPNTIQSPSEENVHFLDFSSGVLAYSSKYWLGVAFDHLNKPNQSLLRGDNIIPLKASMHLGVKISLGNISINKPVFLSPAFNYRVQSNFHQLDAGVYFSNDPMIVGIWYRGIPLMKTTDADALNNDALAFLIGFTYERLRLGYSYDLTLSKLIANSGGSHEISLSYQFCDLAKMKSKKIKRLSSIPCPSF